MTLRVNDKNRLDAIITDTLHHDLPQIITKEKLNLTLTVLMGMLRSNYTRVNELKSEVLNALMLLGLRL